MTVIELLPWITGAGGALVVLFLGCVVFYRLYREERARNSHLVEVFAAATVGGNDRIRELTDAIVDALDISDGTRAAAARTVRRRQSRA